MAIAGALLLGSLIGYTIDTQQRMQLVAELRNAQLASKAEERAQRAEHNQDGLSKYIWHELRNDQNAVSATSPSREAAHCPLQPGWLTSSVCL